MIQKIQYGKQNSESVSERQKISFKAMERTLFGIKPDAFEKGLASTIGQEIIHKTGLKLVTAKIAVQSRKTMEKHYAEHAGKSFFNDLINYITRGKFGAYVLEGDNAILKLRTAASEIREKYAPNQKRENLVHSSDSPDAAAREIKNFFSNLV